MESRINILGGSRRDFLRKAVCAKLCGSGAMGALSQMQLFQSSAVAQNVSGDYKALVCIFLAGGNDSNNMLVPYSGPHRPIYEEGRRFLALPKNDLKRIYPLNAVSGEEWGLHPSCGGMKTLFQAGKLSFVQNVGNLRAPIADRAEFLRGKVDKPARLFSHLDQLNQWQTVQPNRNYTSGWGGRIADLMTDGYTGIGTIPMSITLGKGNRFQLSQNTPKFSVNSDNEATALTGYGPASNPYENALGSNGEYLDTVSGQRLRRFNEIANFSHFNLHEEAYSKVVRSSLEGESTLERAFEEASESGVNFGNKFSSAQHDLGNQLKTVAKLIAARETIGNSRQTFYCQIAGFDYHGKMLKNHKQDMARVSGALLAFQNTLDALGVSDKVVTFGASDFGRTLTPNGSGTDHAWGGHQFVMGGPVRGKRLFGKHPNLTPGGPDDAGGTRGRYIPSTSVDQYSAVMADWFGVDSNGMETIFPILNRFEDPFGATANLNFLA